MPPSFPILVEAVSATFFIFFFWSLLFFEFGCLSNYLFCQVTWVSNVEWLLRATMPEKGLENQSEMSLSSCRCSFHLSICLICLQTELINF